jgi:hypothetical protein
MGRFQALHPATLLVHENQWVGASDRVMEAANQAAQLFGVNAVAFEQNEAGRLRLA